MHGLARSLELTGARVWIAEDAVLGARLAADRIAAEIPRAVAERGRAVLGLATGGTPIRVYQRLVELHQEGKLTFREVSTYNLDEYYPISPIDPRSYRAYMDTHLFGLVDLAPNRAHVLDGTVPEAFAPTHCAEFDRWIAAEGGLDLQLLGIGRNGHIGFNEPSELAVEQALALPSRLVSLHPVTREDALKDFENDPEAVPRLALTLGTAPILAARSILVLAFGPHKAEAVAQALLGPITAAMPASLLRSAPGRVTWILDPGAAEGLPPA
jgi:glucosamine-6-phosphate deaminase